LACNGVEESAVPAEFEPQVTPTSQPVVPAEFEPQGTLAPQLAVVVVAATTAADIGNETEVDELLSRSRRDIKEMQPARGNFY
jgi:hypothetical protein